MSRNRPHYRSNEQGQALIVLTLFFLFVFLVMAALAVDGTIIYLRRRQLQNMADAAALAAAEYLSQHKDLETAYDVAENSIAENKGRVEWYSTDPDNPLPPSTNIGAGVDLLMGIEIGGDLCDVRVALAWGDMGTYFTQFFGRRTLQVGARAHAHCAKAGGLVPIAVRRFGDERHWNMDLKNVNQAQVYCDECSTQQSLLEQGKQNAIDFLRIEGSDVITQWPGFPDLTEEFYETPPDAATDISPGRDHWILGSGVVPNVGTTSYSGLVNLDIRHVSAPPLEYYNGVEPGTQSNTLKDLGEYYIRKGYCCDIPDPGDQVAMYNGTSAAFSPEALQQTYNVSETIAVIIYNGHVLSAPTLDMTGEDPYHKATYPTTDTITSHVLTYTIHLEALNGFQSATTGLIMDVEGLDDFATWDLSPTDRPVLGRNGIYQKPITLVVTPSITTTVGSTITHVVTGTRSFYVSALDEPEPGEGEGGTSIKRYWGGTVTVGDVITDPISGTKILLDKPAVTCLPHNTDQNYPYVTTVVGQQAKYELQLDLWGVSDARDVSVKTTDGYTLPDGLEWVTAPPLTRSTNPNKHPGSKLQLNLKVNDDVVTNTVHTIPLTVSADGTESGTCNLYVLVEQAGATVDEYVEILGYAAVIITGYYNSENPVSCLELEADGTTCKRWQSANAVRGRIISELWDDPSELDWGLRARLVPWDL
ncbi:MAG: hypothetical protein JSV81_17910 [Anaerolineales bacterium]|nr:MAG: hypothetical protein JSV81_17910 [Anaerolineales bacterium]